MNNPEIFDFPEEPIETNLALPIPVSDGQQDYLAVLQDMQASLDETNFFSPDDGLADLLEIADTESANSIDEADFFAETLDEEFDFAFDETINVAESNIVFPEEIPFSLETAEEACAQTIVESIPENAETPISTSFPEFPLNFQADFQSNEADNLEYPDDSMFCQPAFEEMTSMLSGIDALTNEPVSPTEEARIDIPSESNFEILDKTSETVNEFLTTSIDPPAITNEENNSFDLPDENAFDAKTLTPDIDENSFDLNAHDSSTMEEVARFEEFSIASIPASHLENSIEQEQFIEQIEQPDFLNYPTSEFQNNVTSEPEFSDFNSEEDEDRDQFVVFSLDEENFAIDSQSVEEIGYPPEITSLPFVPSWFSGIANMRGDIIAVLDMRRLWDKPKAAADARLKMLVVRSQKENLRVGLIVDDVSEMLRITSHEIESLENASDSKFSEFLQGTMNSNDSVLNFLDAERLLSSPKLRQF